MNILRLTAKFFKKTTTVSAISKSFILIANFISSLFVVFNFSSIEQAYYYTIISLFLVQAFVELGFNSVVLHFVSHARNKIFIRKNIILGNKKEIAKLLSLSRFSLRWISISAFILFIILITVGLYIFSNNQNEFHIISLWIYLSIIFSMAFFIQPIYIFFDGLALIREVCLLRLFQSFVLNISFWILVMNMGGLWSILYAQIFSFISILFVIIYFFHPLLRKLFLPSIKPKKFDWRYEFLPMQWRIAISSLCGYFIFASYTPLTFKYIDEVLAGQVGITLSLMVGMRGLIGALINPYITKYGFLISRNKKKKLINVVHKNIIMSAFFSSLIIISYYFLLLYLEEYNFDIYERFLPNEISIFFFLGNFLICISLPISGFLRSFKEEPLFLLSVSSAIIIIIANIFGAYMGSILIMGVTFLSVNILIIPLIFYKFSVKKKFVESKKI